MKVIFTRGMPASGKSTWAKQFVKDNQDYKRINRDSIRHMLSNYTFDDKNETLVTKIERETIFQLIQEGYNLVIDNMNLNDKNYDDLCDFIISVVGDSNLVDFEVKEFPISLTEAIERDKNRPDSLGESVLKKVWRTYEVKLKQMLERAKPKYDEDVSLPHCIICDIDGSLSNSINRRIFSEDECYSDEIIKPTKMILDAIHVKNYNSKPQEEIKIFIFSGRKDSAKNETIEWLFKHKIPYTELHMRKSDDNRKDTLVKSDMFEEFVRGKYYCDFVIDDRHSVLDMWNQKGLFTFNVNQDAFAKRNF